MLASPAADLQHPWRERSPAVNRLFGFPKPPLALLHREGLGSHPLGLAPRWDWWVKFSPNALDGLSSSSRALARFSLQEARSHSVLPPVAAAASGARRKVVFPFWQLFLPGEIRCPERCLRHSFPLVITLNGQKRGFGRPSTDRATGQRTQSGSLRPVRSYSRSPELGSSYSSRQDPASAGWHWKKDGAFAKVSTAQATPRQDWCRFCVCVFDVAQKWQAVPSNGLDSSTLWGGGEIPSCKLFHDPPRQFQAATALTPPVPCRPLTNQPAD